MSSSSVLSKPALARAEQPNHVHQLVELEPLLERVTADARYEAAPRRVTVRYRSGLTQPVYVHANPALLSSAIANVLRNAVQLSPHDSRIDIDSELADRVCRVIVRDRGPGVPATELQRIFEPFYRLDQNRPGAGIGLAITARVLRELDGGVSAALRDGGGLAITLTLPLADEIVVASADDDRAQATVSDSKA